MRSVSVRAGARRDYWVAAGLAVLPQLLVSGGSVFEHPLARAALAVAGLGIAILALRPFLTAIVVGVLAAAAAAWGAGLAAVCAPCYALARWAASPRPRARPSATLVGGLSVGGLVGLGLTGPRSEGAPTAARLLVATLLLAGSWSVGRFVGERADRADQALARALMEARAVERLRIARELHDIVMHSTGLIVVRAGIANHVADQRPEVARAALTDIEEISRSALREMRSVLGALRLSQDGEDLRPPPKMTDVDDLVALAQAAGVSVKVVAWPQAQLPAPVGTSVVRIVQEALVNVVKHAAPTNCRVSVVDDEGTVRVEVSDDGSTPARQAPSNKGFGLLGIAERARAFGGSAVSGRRPDGGFSVHATLHY